MRSYHIKAMILAAGLGTRLKPFTDSHPKALFEVDGVTLLEHSLRHLRRHGINEVVINVHHFADQIRQYLEENGNFGMDISISDETDLLLETGGGVKKAAGLLTGCDAFIVRNVDVLSDMDLSSMLRVQLAAKPLATLAVRDRQTSRYLLFDDRMQLCGWMNRATGEQRIMRPGKKYNSLAFSGIQAMSPEIFTLITETGRFSLTDLYLRLCQEQPVQGYLDESPVWKDAGKSQPENMTR
ncbi:MAG TPA: nucleotidyltransferase family protein [Bacteroidales bacterium]|nr:nucleotidyltransferase family protein [Bacteroidales bacterium]